MVVRCVRCKGMIPLRILLKERTNKRFCSKNCRIELNSEIRAEICSLKSQLKKAERRFDEIKLRKPKLNRTKKKNG